MVAMILATAGVYALMSFTVARRTAEIGIRVALGANPRRIVMTTFARALTQVAIGLLVGSIPAGLLVPASARKWRRTPAPRSRSAPSSCRSCRRRHHGARLRRPGPPRAEDSADRRVEGDVTTLAARPQHAAIDEGLDREPRRIERVDSPAGPPHRAGEDHVALIDGQLADQPADALA